MQDLTPFEIEAILKGIGQPTADSVMASTLDRPESSSQRISHVQLGELQEKIPLGNTSLKQEALKEVKLKVDVVLGKSTITLEQLLNLKEGQFLSLDKLAGEPVEIEINGRLIAYGEVVAIDDQYGVLFTQFLSKNKA